MKTLWMITATFILILTLATSTVLGLKRLQREFDTIHHTSDPIEAAQLTTETPILSETNVTAVDDTPLSLTSVSGLPGVQPLVLIGNNSPLVNNAASLCLNQAQFKLYPQNLVKQNHFGLDGNVENIEVYTLVSAPDYDLVVNLSGVAAAGLDARIFELNSCFDADDKQVSARFNIPPL